MIGSIREGIENYEKLLEEVKNKIWGVRKTKGTELAVENSIRLYVIERLADVEKVLGLTKDEVIHYRRKFGIPI